MKIGSVYACTALAMICLAANSILCREALGTTAIDPISFTSIRLVSGALTLLLLHRLFKATRDDLRQGSIMSAAALFAYALFFSLAYVTLESGTGALILFGFVQFTMISGGLLKGERPTPYQWLGIVIALGGFVYLLSPGITAPDRVGALMMAIAGIGWGVYSLRGRSATQPLSATTTNFLWTAPVALALWAAWKFTTDEVSASPRGIVLAVASGTITSSIGYAIWYTALINLSATLAAVVQLSVPIITATGGVIFLGESTTLRLTLSSSLILGGIGVVVRGSIAKKATEQT